MVHVATHHHHHLVSSIPTITTVPSVPPVLSIPPIPPASAKCVPKLAQLPPLTGSVLARASECARMAASLFSNPQDIAFNWAPVPDADLVSEILYHLASTDIREGMWKVHYPYPRLQCFTDLTYSNSLSSGHSSSHREDPSRQSVWNSSGVGRGMVGLFSHQCFQPKSRIWCGPLQSSCIHLLQT